jgi:hypothetical protein
MAKAPKPGTTHDEPSAARFRFADGVEVLCDVRSLTMMERRAAKNELKRLGDDVDQLEATVAALWVVMRRDDPELDFLDLMNKVTLAEVQDAEVVDEPAGADDPSL